MKTLKKIAFILAVLALPAFAQPTICTPPAGANLEKFPLKQGPLSVVDMAILGLSPVKLEKVTVVMNHHRNVRGGCWELNTLSVGTVVLVDKSGVIRYKADCGNRIVEVLPCPVCSSNTMVTEKSAGNTSNTGAISQKTDGKSGWQAFTESAAKAWAAGWSRVGLLLGILFPLLLLLLILGLMAGAIYVIVQLFRKTRPDHGQTDLGQNPSVVQPVSTPQPVAQQAAAAPPPAPAPTRPRRFRFTMGQDGGIFAHMDGFQNLRVEETDGGIKINADRVG